jgi:SOS-response transcriptional repressor LexA
VRPTKVGDPLTARQQAIMDFMVECEATGLPATEREIMAHFGIRGTQAIHDHINALIRKGRVWRSNGAQASRSLRVTIIGMKQT